MTVEFKNPAFAEQLEESLRSNESLSQFDGPNDLAKAYIESGETLKTLKGDLEGKAKELETRLKIPGENASDEERNAFFNKLGRPEKPEGYEYQRPTLEQGMTYDEVLESDILKTFHSEGVPKKAAQKILDRYNQYRIEEHKKVQQLIKEVNETELNTLKSVWTGVTFDEKSKKAEQAFKVIVDKIQKPEGWTTEKFIEEFKILGFFENTNPMLKYFMAEMFNLVGDDHFVDGTSGSGTGGNPDRKHLEEMYPSMVNK